MRRLISLAGIAVLIAACSDTSTPTVSSGIAVNSTKSSALNSSLIPGQYIVVFKNNVLNPVAMASSIALQHSTKVTYTYTGALKGVALALSDAEANAMRADPNVAYVEQDQVGTRATTQSNPMWGLDRIDQRARPLDNAYVYSADGTGVTVYIMDTGINYAHVDFGGRAVPGADFVTPSTNGNDCDGHGTGIASLVGGSTYGVAKNVRLVSLRVDDCIYGSTTSRIIAAIDWIATHPSLPSVVNMSIALRNSPAVTQAVQNSIASGVVYAVAAGNNTADACNWSPANAPDALTVAASDDTDGFAGFSNYGPCVDLAAPGTRLNMAWIGSPTAVYYGGGTSYSAPQVAGLAALYLQTNRSATPAQVSAAIVGNATLNALTNVPANTPNLLLYTGFIAAGPVPPVANFTFNCSALSCAFDASNTSTPSTPTYTWTFGDGTSGSGRTPSHAYAASGTYSVTLTVSDANGTSTKTNAVTVTTSNQAPVARFTVTCPTLQCAFDGGTSSDDVGIVSYQWTWGNGRSETHTGSSAKNTFASSGTYMVTLTVTDGGGRTDSVSTAVQVPTSTNQAPTASMTSPSNGTSAVQGTSIPFAGSGADPEDGALSGSSLTWTSSRDGQIGTGTWFATSSLSVGSHVITLTARDAQGLTGSATRSITITAPAPPPPPPTNQAPVARFTATCGAPGSRKCTMNGSTSTDDVSIVSYAWTWGNGRSEVHVGSTATNTWAVSGTYDITLTVKDGSGLTGSLTKTVVVP